MNHNLRKQSINNKLFIHSLKVHKGFFGLIYHSYGLGIIRKDYSRGIKELLENTWLKSNRNKKKLVARVFAASENGVQPVKTAVEIKSDLITNYKNKLKIDDFSVPDSFKIPHGWMEENEGMAFWPMLRYPDIFNFLMFYPSEFDSKALCDYKNSKAYSYYKSRRLQPLLYHNLSGSKYCIIKGEWRKSQSIKDPIHKFWIILEKTVKIGTCHCTGMGGTCNHVTAAMYCVEAAVRIGLTNPACTSNANVEIEKLLNRKR